MSGLPSLTMYPVYRLTVAVGTGIFLFDGFIVGLGKLMPESDCEGWGTDTMLQVALLCLLVAFGLLVRAYLRTNSQRGFGFLTFLTFMLIGGIRLTQERLRLDFNWNTESVLYWGEVQTPPIRKGKMYQAEVTVEAEVRPSQPIDRRILLYWMPDTTQRPVVCGDNMLFKGVVSKPVSDVALTGFDYGNYLYRKGISGTAMAFSGDWQVYSRRNSLEIRQSALQCRNWLVNRYRSWQLGREELAVIAALTVGDKQILTDSLKERYGAAGVSHVLALSGLHIGILSAILYFLFTPLKRLKRGEQLRTFLVVCMLWIFAFVTGLSPSVVRAVTMCSLYFVASCVHEGRFPSAYTLVLSAFLMLIYQPLYLFDVSFQLSFSAVASILYFYPLISNILLLKNRFLVWLWNGISVSFSAQLGTLPLILYYFGTFPTYFLLANLIVSVLAVCVLCGAIGALVVADIPWIGTLSVMFANAAARAMNQSIGWVQHLAGSQLDCLSLSALQAACGCTFLVTLYQFIHHHRASSLIGILLAVNLSLADWNVSHMPKTVSSLHFYRSQLYLKQGTQVTPLKLESQFYVVDNLRIAVLDDDRWRKKEANPRIQVDYIYLCHGFRGNLESLQRVFRFNQLILDTSLSTYYRETLFKQCSQQRIACALSTDEHACYILLNTNDSLN